MLQFQLKRVYHPSGGAVDEWRRQMGATDPQQAARESIRGSFAYSIRQNLVHGSSGDTPQEKITNVKKETLWLKDKLIGLCDQSDQLESYFPTENLLREFNVLSSQDKLITCKRLFNFRQLGAESYLAAYAVTLQNKDGCLQTQYLAQKAIVAWSGCESRAQERVKRLLFFTQQGIKTPVFYGRRGADIFEEYILHAQTAQTAIEMIKTNVVSQEIRLRLLSQLVHTASVLDKYGFVPVGRFWNNLIYNGKDLYLVDTGFDLGSPNIDNPNLSSKKQLLKEFSDQSLREWIEKFYVHYSQS